MRLQTSRRSGATPTLLYKVVEISNVDEGSLEEAVNAWVGQGWVFDGVQFAMRDSSKRPSMAFIFFTRRGGAGKTGKPSARPSLRSVSAHERLAQLAEGGDEP